MTSEPGELQSWLYLKYLFSPLLNRDLVLMFQMLLDRNTGQERDLLSLSLEWRGKIAGLLDSLLDAASDGELAALISYAIAFPDGFMALVDTYDVKK